MDTLTKLHVLSVGNNDLKELDNVSWFFSFVYYKNVLVYYNDVLCVQVERKLSSVPKFQLTTCNRCLIEMLARHHFILILSRFLKIFFAMIQPY